ncbi:hypothetical protein RBB77_16620 [Tunturibacter psychrotolerans]|uniref:Uncharacterized protein n=1 Tax=Tunturiibacter psychrotolerans TaxID=3069686 RepID=A0AAU7ZM92_9BACT
MKTGATAKQGQQQIPFGDDNKKNNGKGRGETRGPLHCAGHDETVNSFGRYDELFALARSSVRSGGEKRVWNLRGSAEE